MAKKDKVTEDNQIKQEVHSKRAILNMPQFKRYYDLLSVILDSSTPYTLEEVDDKLGRFLNGKA